MAAQNGYKKNILFVLYEDLRANSAMHVHNFANQLTLLGFDCVVAVPRNKDSVNFYQSQLYAVTEFGQIDRVGNCFYDGRGPDIVHAWTPREVVRSYCEALSQRYNFALFVHMEDNEEYILEKNLGLSSEELIQNQTPIPPNFSHPLHYRRFLNRAQGITVIIESLKEFCPPNVPTLTLWPGVDMTQFAPGPPNRELKARLNIPSDNTVLCYTGNVHQANQEEVRNMYLAVASLNRQGHPATLVRTGLDFCTFLPEDEAWVKRYAVELGYVSSGLIPALLNLTNILVQPGKSGAFNDYRFPSKLPEFLAMGKPVLLPAANLGRYLHSGEEALILPSVYAPEIVSAVQQIAENPALAARLSHGAVRFAHRHLDWAQNTEKLAGFYEEVCKF